MRSSNVAHPIFSADDTNRPIHEEVQLSTPIQPAPTGGADRWQFTGDIGEVRR